LLANLAIVPHAFAATLTHSSILEIGGASNVSPMIASDGQALAVDFTTASAGATTLSINFNNFTGGTVNSTQTASSSGCASYFSGATPLPGTLSPSETSNTISISGITGLSTTTNYCVILTSTSAVTNPSTPGVYSALLTVGSDSQTDPFDVLSAGGNAYSLTASVGPTFTMSLGGTTDTIGALSSTVTTVSTGITATINTNAASGWGLWAEDTNGGLHSAQAGHPISSVSTTGNHTMATGSEQYALGLSAFNTTNYAYNGGTTGGGLSNSAYNQIATSNTTATGATTVLHELVDISATTPPATDYTDTITVIGAGSF
jgi:hypothetical protein